MIQKTFLCAVAVLLVLAPTLNAFALSADASKLEYFKGEAFSISGSCKSGSTVLVSGMQGAKHVFESLVACANEGYAFEWNGGFLIPSGAYQVRVQEMNSSIGPIPVLFTVKPVKESGYLVLTLLNPTALEQERGKALPVSVQVTDAGVPVSGAQTGFFGVNGEWVELIEGTDGVYSASYLIPIDAPVKRKWEFSVLSQVQKQEGMIGGETTAFIQVNKAPLIIDWIEPKSTTLVLQGENPLSVRITYPNSQPLKQGEVKAKLNGVEQPLQSNGNGVYSLQNLPLAGEGNIQIEVLAQDAHENTGQASKSFVARATLFSRVNEWGLSGVALIIVLLGAGAYWKWAHRRSREQERAMEKIERAKQELGKLQEAYVNNPLYSKDQYKTRSAQLNKDLADAQARLKSLEGNKGLRTGEKN